MADENTDVKETKQPKDKSKGMMLIIIVMLGVIIAAIVGGVILLLGQLDADPSEGGQTVIIHEPPPVSEQDIYVLPLNTTIQTNLLQPPGGARHIIRVDVALGINNTDEEARAAVVGMLREREASILDLITSTLRQTTRDEIDREGGSDLLADELLILLQERFDEQLIVRVYFPNIVTH